MMVLFEMSTTEGWLEVMYAMVDANYIDMQPIKRNNELWALFAILFMVFSSFLMLNLFVGVVIDKFNQVFNFTYLLLLFWSY